MRSPNSFPVLSIILGVLSFSTLFAYEAGEKIDGATMKALQLPMHKTAVVSFFASWCNPCRIEVPKIIDAYHAVEPGRAYFVGIDIDKDTTKGKAFQKMLRIPYRVVNDPNHTLVSKFNPVGIPALYIISDGRVVRVFTGADDVIDRHILHAIGVHR